MPWALYRANKKQELKQELKGEFDMKMSKQVRSGIGGEWVTKWTRTSVLHRDEIYEYLIKNLLCCFVDKNNWIVESIERGCDEDGNGAIIVNMDDNVRCVYTLDE